MVQFNIRGRRFAFFEKAGDDPRLRAKEAEAESGKGAFWYKRATRYNIVNGYTPEDIDQYYKIYLDNDLVRLYVDDLVEAACGTGYYTTVDVLTPILQKSRSKEFVDRFGKVFNMDHMTPNIARNTLIAGFCPVERILVKGDVEDNAMKIVHPKTVKWIEAESGEVKYILQYPKKTGEEPIRIDGDNLAWFNYCQIGNDVRGTSLIRSALNLVNTLNSTTTKVDEILDRYISPLGIWKSKRPISALKKAVAEREAGEDIFLGELTDEEIMAENMVEFIRLDPRVPFWEYIEYLDRRIYSVFRGSNLWFVRNATQASARIMDKIVARHVRMIQRDLKRGIEGQIFTPLITINNLPEVPKVHFNTEPTGIDEINIDNFLMIGLQSGYVTEEEFRSIIRRLGVPLPRIKGERDPSLGPHADAEPDEQPRPPQQRPRVPTVPKRPETPTVPKVTPPTESMRFMWLSCTKCGYRMLNPGIAEMYMPYWSCPRCRHMGVQVYRP